jgi:hypothetical protein
MANSTVDENETAGLKNRETSLRNELVGVHRLQSVLHRKKHKPFHSQTEAEWSWKKGARVYKLKVKETLLPDE